MEVLAPPPTDPLVRQEPPFDWYRTPDETRPRVETASPLPDLDPDVALWPVTPVNRWPFTGAPAEGIWPKGWIGVDNTGTAYVCTVGGEPGTWVAVGSGGGGGWPTVNGTGAGNLTATLGSGDTTGYNFTDNGSGGFNVTAGANSGVTISAANDIAITQSGIGSFLLDQTNAANAQGVVIRDGGTAGVTIDSRHTGPITIETTGGAATTGIALTTQATDTGGISLTDSGSGGVKIQGVTRFAGSGSPVGVVTPKSIGDLYVDDTTPGLWQATGVTSADWSQVGTSGQIGLADFPRFDASGNTHGSVPADLSISLNALCSAAASSVGGVNLTTGSCAPSLYTATSVVMDITNLSDTTTVTGVDTTTDDLLLAVIVTVANQAGTEAIQVTASGDVPQVGPDQTGTVDWSTATPVALAGTDLSWDPAVGISSAAGGIYSADLQLVASWD